jgi:N-acetylneuraminic acid mutarotase
MAPIVPHGRTEAVTLAGAAGVPSGCAHIVFAGGVNKQRFEAAINRPLLIKQARLDAQRYGTQAMHAYVARLELEKATYMRQPEAWYAFNDELIIYHTITNTYARKTQQAKLCFM